MGAGSGLAGVLCLAAGVAVCLSQGATASPSARPGAAPHPHGAEQALDCSACHTQAGWGHLTQTGPDGHFDHDCTGFPLRGQHGRAACTACHRAGEAITRRCNACHEDPHQARLAADCSTCHSADTWLRTDAIERHRLTRLPLTGMHALIDCTQCHRRASDRTWSSAPADCYACHVDDYRRSDVHPRHVGSADGAPPIDRDCGVCHQALAWSPAIIPVGSFSQALTPRGAWDHDRRFVLSMGPHRDSACGDCHLAEDGRGPVRCIGCHAHDPTRLRRQHRGEAPVHSATACLGCHPSGAAR